MRRAEGETHFVIDLGSCTGMDSTFMGFLAGLATGLNKTKGWVQIADPGERNRKSLEDLGLDFLVDIEPTNAPWCGKIEEIRGELIPFTPKQLMDAHDRARHVLESHQTLAETSEENADRFENVLKILEKEVLGKPDKPKSGE